MRLYLLVALYLCFHARLFVAVPCIFVSSVEMSWKCLQMYHLVLNLQILEEISLSLTSPTFGI